MLPEFSCSGKVAIITGGGRGMGRAIALALAEAGADIVVAGRTPETLNKVKEEVTSMGHRCLPVRTDVSVPEQVDSMVSRAVAEMGKIDILVCNAGTVLHKSLVPMPHASTFGSDTPISNDEWLSIMNTNLNGAFYCLRAVGPRMIKQDYGKIIVISTMLTLKAASYRAAYVASKSGLNGLVKSMAHEWARHKICINAIAPNLTNTGMAEWAVGDKAMLEKTVRAVPMRRLAEARDVALAAVYLASPASDYMTGQVIAMDGGQSA